MAELIQQDPGYAPASTATDPETKPTVATRADPEARSLQPQEAAAGVSGVSQAVPDSGQPMQMDDQKPLSSVLAGIIDDDDMEDLFGPGTGSSTTTGPSPQIALQQQNVGTSRVAQQPFSLQPEQGATFPGAPSNISQSNNSLGIDLSGIGGAQATGFTAGEAMPNFGQQGQSSADMTNTLSGDDFNALLAGLGGGSGNGDDLLQGFSLGRSRKRADCKMA